MAGNYDPFSIKVHGRAGLVYKEGEHRMEIDGERLVGSPGRVLYTDSIQHWEPPHHDEAVTAEKRAEIIENIRTAFQGWGIEIDTQERSHPSKWGPDTTRVDKS